MWTKKKRYSERQKWSFLKVWQCELAHSRFCIIHPWSQLTTSVEWVVTKGEPTLVPSLLDWGLLVTKANPRNVRIETRDPGLVSAWDKYLEYLEAI